MGGSLGVAVAFGVGACLAVAKWLICGWKYRLQGRVELTEVKRMTVCEPEGVSGAVEADVREFETEWSRDV